MFQHKYLNRRYRPAPEPINPHNLNNSDLIKSPPQSIASPSFAHKLAYCNRSTQPIPYHEPQFRSEAIKQKYNQSNTDLRQKLSKNPCIQDSQQDPNPNTKKIYKEWLQSNSNKIKFKINHKHIISDLPQKLNSSIKNQLMRNPSCQIKDQSKYIRNTYNIPNNKYKLILNTSSIESGVKSKEPYLLPTQNIRGSSNQLNLIPNRKLILRGNHSQDKVEKANLSTGFKYFTMEQSKTNSRLYNIHKIGTPKNNLITTEKTNEESEELALRRSQNNLCKGESSRVKEIDEAFPLINKSLIMGPLENYYAESFKGRRPYNQDRYICEIQQNFSLRQKFKFFSKKPQNFNELSNGSVLLKCQEPSQNKFYLFGVFDGHGGSKCSQFLQQNFYKLLSVNRNLFTNPELALVEAFAKIQEKFLFICEKDTHVQKSGSCAVVCLIINGKMFFGNVGDSRALLINKNQVKQITKDHKPDEKSEKFRIVRHGGKIYKDGSMMGVDGKQNVRIFHQSRVMPGNLNISRTIGDIEAKNKKYGGLPGTIISEPQIFTQSLNSDFQYLLLASDGLFQGLTNNQIHQTALGTLNFNKETKNNEQVKNFTKQLISKGAEKSNDNITVISVKIPHVFFKEI